MSLAEVEEAKACSRCGRVLPIEQFIMNGNFRRLDCLECCASMTRTRRSKESPAVREKRLQGLRDYYRADPDRLRNSKLRRRFGITLAQYRAISAEQNGKCAICGGQDEGKLLAVDHSHKTGAIRGLLCQMCNRALGAFQDDPAILARAIEYLEEARCRSVG